MKKIVLSLILTCLLVLPVTGLQAASPRQGLTNATPEALRSQGTIPETVGVIVNTVIGMMGVLLLALIIYGGFVWMTAKGDPAQVKKGQDVIRAAVTGLIITLAAYALATFLIGLFVD